MKRTPEYQLAADLASVARSQPRGVILAQAYGQVYEGGHFTVLHKNGRHYRVSVKEVRLLGDMAVGEVWQDKVVGKVERIEGETKTEAGDFVAVLWDGIPAYMQTMVEMEVEA